VNFTMMLPLKGFRRASQILISVVLSSETS
jgi:hypothetical protein